MRPARQPSILDGTLPGVLPREQRAHERVELRLAVTLEPLSERCLDRRRLLAETRNVSAGGMLLGLDTSPQVGERYRVRFERNGLGLGEVEARCLRSSVAGEGRFEAAFRFDELAVLDLAAARGRFLG